MCYNEHMGKHEVAVSTTVATVVRRYKKAFVAASGILLSAFLGGTTGGFTVPVVLNIIIAALNAASVAIAPNVPGSKYTKAVIAAVMACATVVISAYTGGITLAEWQQIVVAGFIALGIREVPNEGDMLERSF